MSAAKVFQFVVLVAGALLASIFVGTVIHEFGHGMTAVALGGKIEVIWIWPGITLSPEFQLGGGNWSQFGGLSVSVISPGWDWGVYLFMGSCSTSIAAYSLIVAAHFSRRRSWIGKGFLVASIAFAWDIFLYSTLPLLGFRHGLLIGGRSPEPLIGVEMMGIPRYLYFLFLLTHFVLFHSFAVIVARSVTSKNRKFGSIPSGAVTSNPPGSVKISRR